MHDGEWRAVSDDSEDGQAGYGLILRSQSAGSPDCCPGEVKVVVLMAPLTHAGLRTEWLGAISHNAIQISGDQSNPMDHLKHCVLAFQ